MVGIGQGDAVSLSALCEQIKGPNSKKGCYGTIARVDPLLCERIGETETDLDRARCYQALSWDRAGIACDQIPNVAGQMSCYKDRAQRMRDPALCEKLGETRERDDCFSMLVTATGDASLCLRVRNPDVASNCVSRVDSSKLTYALCILLPKGYQRDKCIFDVKHAPRKP
jgi:hypothetical protein